MVYQDKFVYLMKCHWKEVSLYLEKAWIKEQISDINKH